MSDTRDMDMRKEKAMGQVGLKSNRGNSSMRQRRVLWWIMQQRTPDLIRMHTLAERLGIKRERREAEIAGWKQMRCCCVKSSMDMDRVGQWACMMADRCRKLEND